MTDVPIHVVFCGLVRRPDLFKTTLEALAPLRERGLIDRVIYSTWSGELNRYPELFNALVSASVEIVETPEPLGYPGIGHIYLQKLALKYALDQLPENDLVLRLRPDTLFQHRISIAELIPYLVSQFYTPSEPLGGLKQRVFTGTYNHRHPFWLEDRYFAGIASDLTILTDSSIDLEYISHKEACIAEVSWFARPYTALYQVARDCMRVGWLTTTIPGRHSKGGRFCDLIDQQLDLQRMLAAYHYILERSFIIGVDPYILATARFDTAPEPVPADNAVVRRISDDYADRLPGYAAFREMFRADEAQLGGPLLDEEKLATDLLEIGSLLVPRSQFSPPLPNVLGADTETAEYYQNFDFGVALFEEQLTTGGGSWASVAWVNKNGRLDIPPGRGVYLAAEWLHADSPPIQLPWIKLDHLNRISGEQQFLITAPERPGEYTVNFRLVADGIGWSVKEAPLTVIVVK